MGYDFRERTASQSKEQILKIIVRHVLMGRTTESLVQAYVDSMKEDWEEETEEEFVPTPLNYEKLGVILKPAEIERVMTDAFVEQFRKRCDHPVTREEALDAFEYPLVGFPDEMVPHEVVVRVAQAIANREAEGGNMMRREMMRKLT